MHKKSPFKIERAEILIEKGLEKNLKENYSLEIIREENSFLKNCNNSLSNAKRLS